MSEKQANKPKICRRTAVRGDEGRQSARRRCARTPVAATVDLKKQRGRGRCNAARPDIGGSSSHARTMYCGLQRPQVEHLPADMHREAVAQLAGLLLMAAREWGRR